MSDNRQFKLLDVITKITNKLVRICKIRCGRGLRLQLWGVCCEFI